MRAYSVPQNHVSWMIYQFVCRVQQGYDLTRDQSYFRTVISQSPINYQMSQFGQAKPNHWTDQYLTNHYERQYFSQHQRRDDRFVQADLQLSKD